MFFSFVWSNRLHTISKNVLIQPVELGGLKTISTECIVESAKVMWIKRFCNSFEAKWKILALNLMGIEKSMLIRKQLLKDITKKAKTNFYADLLTVWFSIINANVRSIPDLLDGNIFDNPLFLKDNKMINVKNNNWTDAGILKVSDVWNDTTNTFICPYKIMHCARWVMSVCLFVYLGFYVAFNTVQVISRRVVGRAEETST